MRDFNEWLLTFKENIATYDFYVDFKKVYKNVDDIKIELNILNSLIGSKKVEEDFDRLITKYPEVLECIPILLAKREHEIFCKDENGEINYKFGINNIEKFEINKYKYFMKKTGLFDLISKHLINNLVDYVLGVEVGLDSNGRKNRGGHLMENLVESYIIKAGFIKNKTYYKEMYLSDLEKLSGLDLSNLSNKGKAKKRFDFVFIKDKTFYACECNFYSSNGSKLNETARSYKTLALESKDISNFKFIWFTDGQGWFEAKNNLQETFDVLDTLYNINDLEHNILENLD